MIDNFELESERYKIVAMLSECVLFEYHITSKILYKFDSYGKILRDFDVIKNFRYNENLLSLIHEEDLEQFYEFCNELDTGKDRLNLDLRFLENNIYQWFEIKGHTLYNEDNVPVKVIGKISNIDTQKKEKEKLKERSERDPLTTLYNKETTERLVNKFLKIEGADYQGILLLIDFDNFKGINDNLGHLFGDSVLRDVSSQLRKVFRSTDVIGRVGGDEFVIYISGKCHGDTISQKTEEILRIFDKIYTDKDKQLATSCSIGIALAPKHGTNYKELFKRADIALYQAKNSGKGCYQVFNEVETNKSLLNSKKLFNSYETRNEHIVTEGHGVNELAIPFFNLLYFSEDFKSAMHMVLSMLGQEYDLGRIYVAERSKAKRYLDYTYEWSSENVLSSNLVSGPIHLEESEGYAELFNEDGVFYSNDISNIKFQSEATYDYYSKKNVKSILQCIILEEGSFIGIVGCEICHKIHTWKKKEVENLIIISRIIGSFVSSYHKKELLKEDKIILKEISKNQNLLSYVLKPNTFELMIVNESTTEIYPNAKKGDICYEIFSDRDSPCENCPILGLTNNKKRNTVDFYNRSKNLRLKSTATKIEIEGIDAILVCAAEVTDIIETIQGKDDLTGLLSLSRFERDANSLLSVNTQYALLTIDIDKFKNINSTLGYQEGNRMLITLVDIISSKLRAGELFCRSYADKFILMLEYENYNYLVSRANRIFNNAINLIQARYNDLHVVIAGGMYIINQEDNEIAAAIDKANIARKSIKGSHRSILANYDDKIHRKVMQEKQVESRMVAALNNKEFVVYFQPKIDLRTNRIVGAEALVRWKINESTVIPPNDFIPIFEKNGFINQVDFYVYESVFAKMREWARLGHKMIPISVNISRTHISEKDFVTKMKNLVNRYNIPPEMVELEITEGIFLSDKAPLIEVLNNLKKIGFHLSIDDFGTGYSSLNLLRHLKMDVLKLDKDFFDQDKISSKESIVLANVIRMSKELGMVVLSEGVETKEQAEYLASIGCDLAQGYYFARPMPMEEFESFIYN